MFWLTENIFTANIKKKYISHYSVEAFLYDDVSQIRSHLRTHHFTLKANKQVSAAQVGGGEGDFLPTLLGLSLVDSVLRKCTKVSELIYELLNIEQQVLNNRKRDPQTVRPNMANTLIGCRNNQIRKSHP